MPYRYKHADRYETLSDIEKEYRDPYKHSSTMPGMYNSIRLKREARAKERQTFLEAIEFEDQMAPRVYSCNIDLRNKYEIMQAIDILQAALRRVEQEEFNIPYDPSGMYK